MIADKLPGLFAIQKEEEFRNLSLDVFRFQSRENKVYREFLQALGKNPESIQDVYDIPFLPVEFFKSHELICGNETPEIIFTSSSTTGQIPSRHLVEDLSLYEESYLRTFKMFYGNPEDYCILALLPSYLERSGSSLVYMMNGLIKMSRYSESGFYLYEMDKLHQVLKTLQKQKAKILLLGVSFALWELAEKYPLPLENTILMETGGMKGRREEITREELHGILCSAFQLNKIHSEYGMTELLSQAYSKGDGKFVCPPWMRILIRDPYDPFHFLPPGKTGAINIIDLANLYSCSFLATSDLGKLHEDGSFEVLGRLDQSELRGCNLMYS